ncbi:MAG: NAD(P)-binding domain-containing protein, partial [Clostridia bacterium]|nr:NAD(P)-binding domain-containing protein [Clostridia bacterium]
MNYKYKLGFIGCGNMAKAIINGLLDSNLLKAENMFISTPSISQPYREINFTNCNQEVLSTCEYVVLAVKPQIFKEISADFAKNNCKCIVSIMAGVNTDTIAKVCNCPQVVRIMPNTPCSIGEGVSAITSYNADNEIDNFVESIFQTISKGVRVDEMYFAAV